MNSATFDETPSIGDGIKKITKKQEFLFCFTEFFNLNATSKKTTRGTWNEFLAGIKNPKAYARKSDMPLIKCAEFGDTANPKGCLRTTENMGSVYGIEIDYDAGLVSIDQAAAMLETAGIEAVIYTTPSHSIDRPRWRVIVLLSKPYSPSERALYVATVNAILGGVAAPESFKPSQSFYIGRVEGVPYEWRHVKGDPVDDGPHFFITPDYGNATGGNSPDSSFDTDDIPEPVLIDTLRDIESAVRALSIDRANEYTPWVSVLQHLRHLAWCGHLEIAKKLAREFSQRSEKYTESEFNKKWQGLPLNKGHFKTIFDLATSDGWVNPRKGVTSDPKDMTDAGNVNMSAELTDGNLRFVHESRKWINWNGNSWDDDHAASRIVKAALALAAIYKEKSQSQDAAASESTTAADKKLHQKIADSYRNFSNYCRNKRGIDALVSLATRDDRFVIFQRELDRDPYLLGVKNGVVDLRTGELRGTAREDFITKQSPYAYLENATAPRFLQFMGEVTSLPIDDGENSGNMKYKLRPTLVRYIQKALGYALTGTTLEHKMFIASGGGANGKSILFDILEHIMGDYAGVIPCESLMASSRGDDSERPTPFARSVAGKRLIVTTEAKEGQKLNAALIKRQTGDAKLVARGMRENAVTFDVTHKLFMLTNHTPELDQSDDAIRGRLHFIPFDRTWNRPGVPNRNPRLADGDKLDFTRFNRHLIRSKLKRRGRYESNAIHSPIQG